MYWMAPTSFRFRHIPYSYVRKLPRYAALVVHASFPNFPSGVKELHRRLARRGTATAGMCAEHQQQADDHTSWMQTDRGQRTCCRRFCTLY
jgi:hypothetical protein